MADIPASGPLAAPDRADTAKTIGSMANWAGAAVSLALVVGIGVWGYKMLARDVSGVPVVRAAQGKPMRVQPADPGGSPAEHQGLAVNSVAAVGSAEAPADRLILAPAPVELNAEDAPGGGIVAVARAETQPVARAMPVSATQAGDAPLSPQMASIRALAEQLSAGAKPLSEPEPAPETVDTAAAEPATPEPAPVVQKAVVKGGLKSSLRPLVRPGGLKKAEVVPAAAQATEIEVASVATGTRLAQLGAFESPEVARTEWDRLNARFADYLEGKQRVIQKAQSGGRTFYRLRAMGFEDLNDARRFCSALVAERAECIPVTAK
jgi:hypothetical protein